MQKRRKAVRVVRPPMTAEELQRLNELRAKVDLDKAEIIAEGKRILAADRQVAAKLREAFSLLKSERVRQGLSLSAVEERSGIGRGALSRMENELEGNPTVNTLERYAEALGKTLLVTFAPAE